MQPYEGLASYYDLLYERGVGIDFVAEDAKLTAEIRQRVPRARTLLEAACGTGAHLRNLRREFEVWGLDISPAMLAVARRAVAGVPLHQGDLRNFRLGQRFDVVLCLFASIAYVKTIAGLRRAVRNLAAHTARGGLVVIDAWLAPSVFQPGYVGVQQASDGDVTVVRLSTSSRRGRISIMDWHFLLARRGRVEYFKERHEVGLFEPAEYAAAMEAAGLVVEVDPEGALGRGRGRYFGLKR
jgi:SAM-dependent methyltransferase